MMIASTRNFLKATTSATSKIRSSSNTNQQYSRSLSKISANSNSSSSSNNSITHISYAHKTSATLLLGLGVSAATYTIASLLNSEETTKSSSSWITPLAFSSFSSSKTAYCDAINYGTPTKEPSTGILFPNLCNGLAFVGCGVRVKYGFVKVYAVGTYMDPIAMSAIKKQTPDKIEKALLDPTYPRTIRIVMNRGLSIDKYTAAIVEALGPRMGGEDMDKLEEFKKLNPAVDLIEGAEMEMTIRGDTMLYKNSVGGVGQIQSHVFCKALCDVYYGDDSVSPGHKEEVIKGITKL